jgi:hypothetical protein
LTTAGGTDVSVIADGTLVTGPRGPVGRFQPGGSESWRSDSPSG